MTTKHVLESIIKQVQHIQGTEAGENKGRGTTHVCRSIPRITVLVGTQSPGPEGETRVQELITLLSRLAGCWTGR